MYTLHFDDSVN